MKNQEGRSIQGGWQGRKTGDQKCDDKGGGGSGCVKEQRSRNADKLRGGYRR